ncbi:hypothetical protein HK101_008046 [Irineochytrium annulatum]|nr:hypothetical protein HK101_008046 [Irineochytrium annulatum]
MITPIALLVLSLARAVRPHGFIVGVGGINGQIGTTREYSKISYQIDDLRNPVSFPYDSYCRDAGASSPVDMKLANDGGHHTVTFAFDVGAQHTGICKIEVFDPNDPSGTIVQIKYALKIP